MMRHLRYSGLPKLEQEQALVKIIRANSELMDVLEGVRELDLADWLLVSGAIYNSVWNYLTDREIMTGVNDFDVFYFDDSDLSYGAEDLQIKRVEERFAELSHPVELRNQARVHLWAPEKFGHSFAPLMSSKDMLDKFASKTHAVGVRLLDDDGLNIVAPFGLDDMFSFRVTPNPALNNQTAHDKKAARAKNIWPELTIVPWPES